MAETDSNADAVREHLTVTHHDAADLAGESYEQLVRRHALIIPHPHLHLPPGKIIINELLGPGSETPADDLRDRLDQALEDGVPRSRLLDEVAEADSE